MGLTFIDALQDRQLFGGLAEFEDLSTWRRHVVFWKAVDGLPLADDELEIFRHHTGRQEPREGGYPESVQIVGVQSGKSTMAGTKGAYDVARAIVSGLRDVYVILVAQDLRGAQRALFAKVKAAVGASPLLSGEVVRETRTEIEFTGGVVIAVYPCRPSAVRGVKAVSCIADELAHFTATDGRPRDAEMVRVLRTRLASTGGPLHVLTSPYSDTGSVGKFHRDHYGRDDSPVLVWKGTTPEMNPTVSEGFLERLRVEDPEAYRNEIEAEFRKGVSTFLDPDALAGVVEEGVRERQPEHERRPGPGDRPVANVRYVGYVDAASGSGKDSFAVGIAHRDGERAVLDVVRSWQPPFNPSGVIAEAAELLRRYRVSEVSGDKYAPGFVEEGFRRHGIRYKAAPKTTSEVYLELLPLVNSGAVAMLDHPALLRELRGLERRRGSSGRDRVDHRPGAHDDRAVAAAGALVALSSAPRPVRLRKVMWG